MATGAAAFQTAQNCLGFVEDQIDFDAIGSFQINCNLAPATTDTHELHIPWHDLVGAQGHAAVQIFGASLSITGAVSNGGLCEITVPSTATYSLNEIVSVYGVGGATGCNGTWQVTVTDGTHLTLQSTTFGRVYTSGGTATNGSVINVTGDVAFACFYGYSVEIWNIFFQSNLEVLQPQENCYSVFGEGNTSAALPRNLLLMLNRIPG